MILTIVPRSGLPYTAPYPYAGFSRRAREAAEAEHLAFFSRVVKSLFGPERWELRP